MRIAFDIEVVQDKFLEDKFAVGRSLFAKECGPKGLEFEPSIFRQ
jgi:hypothetical protein